MRIIALKRFVAALVLSVPIIQGHAAGLPDAVNGVITVDGEVTVADAEASSRLESASEIILSEGARLFYSHSEPLTLNARVSGRGAFIAHNAGQVTLLGDNSGLVAPGCFAFTNTPVMVKHSFGLGSSETATAHVYGDPQALRFDHGGSAFTNNVPLYLHSKSDNVKIGSEALDKAFVQNASLFYYTDTTANGGRTVFFANNFEMISGTFTVKDTSSAGMYLKKGNNSVGSVRFSGSARIENPANKMMIIYANSARFECEYMDVPGGIATDHAANIVFGGENMLTERTYFRPYAQGLISDFKGNNYYIFNGQQQIISHLDYNSINPSKFAYIGSDDACTLKAVSSVAGFKDAPYFFNGNLSYWHDTAKTNVFRALSESTGSLKVTRGQVVFGEGDALASNGGGWSGNEIFVSGEGSLRCSNPNALSTGRHKLVVDEGGELVIDAGIRLIVDEARFGTVVLESLHEYSIDDLKQLLTGQNVRLSGSGSVLVTPPLVSAEWTGWPEIGTSDSVVIPSEVTAEITDEDVEKVAALRSIVGGKSSRIICRNLQNTLVINADISGGCEIEMERCAKVVLAGDNSALWIPGGFVFTGTDVVVSNMYGLGSSNTAAARFSQVSGTNKRMDLSFGGSAISNFVPIVMNFGFEIGHADPEVDFVQCASFTHNNGNNLVNVEDRGYYRNKFHFGPCNATLGGVSVFTGSRLVIDPEGKVAGVDGIFGGGEMHIASQDFRFDMLRIEQCVSRVVMQSDYALNQNGVVFYYDGSHPDLIFDLNGYDQKIGSFTGNQYQSLSIPNALSITSSVPASIFLCGSSVAGIAAKFLGEAGLVYCGSSTQKLGIVKSPTLAPLAVESGALLFERGGGWLGTNIVVNGGRLIVSASAATNTFGVGRDTRTVLEVSPRGTVELESGAWTSTVKSIVFDGKLLKRGIYSAENCSFITGRGSIRAISGLPEGYMLIVR